MGTSEKEGICGVNDYQIKIDGMYLVGINNDEIGKAPVGGMYDEGKCIGKVITTRDKEKAKIIEGNINLKSYFNKIYDAVRYGGFNFNHLEIVRVNNESN